MFRRIHKDETGFTLIELLVVIIIIGILASIAIPVFLRQRQKGWDAQAKSDARNVANMEEAYLVGNVAYADFDSTAVPASGEFSGFRSSGTTVTKATATAATGYCILSKSRSGSYFVYDSLSGGLNNTSFPTVPAAWAAGSSCNFSAPPMP